MAVLGQNNGQFFMCPLDRELAWRINDCVDLIRLRQMPLAGRKQRPLARGGA